MQKEPLTDEQLWGDPEACKAHDKMIERRLEKEPDPDDEEEYYDSNFDQAHECPVCCRPFGLCLCRCNGGK